MGTWELDLHTLQLTWSRELHQLLGRRLQRADPAPRTGRRRSSTSKIVSSTSATCASCSARAAPRVQRAAGHHPRRPRGVGAHALRARARPRGRSPAGARRQPRRHRRGHLPARARAGAGARHPLRAALRPLRHPGRGLRRLRRHRRSLAFLVPAAGLEPRGAQGPAAAPAGAPRRRARRGGPVPRPAAPRPDRRRGHPRAAQRRATGAGCRGPPPSTDGRASTPPPPTSPRSEQTSERLRRSQEQLQQAGALARVGGWDLDVLTRQAQLERGGAPALRGARRLHAPVADLAAFYSPARHRRLRWPAADACERDGTPYDLELEVITARGRTVWTRHLGNAERVDGRTVRLFGAFQDVTEQREAREAGAHRLAGEVAVPGQHQPRDPHAAQRHPGHDPAGARHAALRPSSATTSTRCTPRARTCWRSSTTSSTSRRSSRAPRAGEDPLLDAPDGLRGGARARPAAPTARTSS